MPRPFFLLMLRVSSTYGVVFAQCCHLSTWGGQHRHLHSILGIVAYFCVNYKFFDRRYGRKGGEKRQNGVQPIVEDADRSDSRAESGIQWPQIRLHASY